MGDLFVDCPNCGNHIIIKCGQIDMDVIYWFRSWDCSHCGFKCEEDGTEIAENLREILKQRKGCWDLIIPEGQRNTQALKVIKDVIGLSIKDVAILKKDSAAKVYSGTKTEAIHYHRRCKENGVELFIVKV